MKHAIICYITKIPLDNILKNFIQYFHVETFVVSSCCDGPVSKPTDVPRPFWFLEPGWNQTPYNETPSSNKLQIILQTRTSCHQGHVENLKKKKNLPPQENFYEHVLAQTASSALSLVLLGEEYLQQAIDVAVVTAAAGGACWTNFTSKPTHRLHIFLFTPPGLWQAADV